MKHILVLCLLLFVAPLCFSQIKPFDFSDGTQINLPLSPVDYSKIRFAKVSELKVARKTATVFWESIGKARPLDLPGKLSNADFRKQSKLLAQIDKITTLCEFKQNEQNYNIHCLNSVRLDKLPECSDCKIEITMIIMEFKISRQSYFVPLIETAEEVKSGKRSSRHRNQNIRSFIQLK